MSDTEQPSTIQYDDSTEARNAMRDKIHVLERSRINKNSEGWEAIQDARDLLYKEFFAIGTTDHGFKFDNKEFLKALDHEARRAASRFTFEEPTSYEDCRLLILSGLTEEWEKRVEQTHENMDLGEIAITASFRQFDIPNLLDSPARPELSE